MPVAIATALALLVPLSIAELQPLTKTERRRLAWLSPAILAGAFFGASLVPLVPGPWLLRRVCGDGCDRSLAPTGLNYAPNARRDPATKTDRNPSPRS